MKPIIYLTALALGIFGLAAGIQPDNQLEIFWGILIPWAVSIIELFFVFKMKEKSPQLTTKVLMIGFGGKMIIFGLYLFTIIYFYSFEPYPFMFSFAGSFLAFHTLEAFVLKSLY
jgi:FtsH-binding integral membrane protein